MTDWMQSQVEARAKQDARMAQQAYAQLAASVSEPVAPDDITYDMSGANDAAARACLHYLGVEPGEVPQNVTDAAERINFLCRPTGTMWREVQLTGDWSHRAFGAMLAHLDNDEAVALLPRGTGGYCYVDPTTGRKRPLTRELLAHIQPKAILFYRPLPARKLKIGDLVTFILRVFDRSDYLLVLVAAIAVTLVGLVPAHATQLAYGVVAPSGQAGLILPIAALLLGAVVSSALTNACRNLVMARVSTKLNVVTEAATFARVLSLPSSFFKDYASGDLASRVSTITALTQQIATMMLGSGLSALLSLVYVLQIGIFTPALALPALAVAIVQAALTIFSTVLTIGFERETMEASAKLSGEETALLNGIQKLKLAGAEERAFAKWAKGYAEYARPAYNRPALVNALPAIVGLVGLLGNAIIYYIAASSGTDVANFMAFSTAFGQVTGAIMAFANIAGQIAQINPMLDMVAPILEATPETAEDKPPVRSLSGAIEVTGVSFRYDEGQSYVLKDLSFSVKSGEYVALVGASGCGKSTIVRLLLGFETPDRGGIYYGSCDVSKVDLRSLRRHVGVVMQDGQLFMGDIASNITISTPMASLDDAWEAAELAGIADDIRKMPMGMQTLLTEGSGGVSGGQRQRLMIARAVCGKRRILIFDEATSALDNKTQKHVSEALDALKCTRIVVAHRLSTVRHCDRILVVDGGHIAEEGSYDELIAKGGIFAELVERQRLNDE